jgi:hypothetical protein
VTATRTKTTDPLTRIEIGTRHTAHVFGNKVWAQAVAAHIPHARCPWCRELIVPANRAQDLATHLELRGKPVVVASVLI